ncbi:MAG: glutamine synthetase catalytic region [Gammaproteobacteria bacterium]|nr:glutamine synthetase catalytic region [Gammaproteobacteria bacterium]
MTHIIELSTGSSRGGIPVSGSELLQKELKMDETIQIIKGRLEAKGIKFVRFLWCDTANIIRAKALHVDSLNTQTENGIALASSSYGFPGFADTIAPTTELQTIGQVFLRPDWDTLVFPPCMGAHACVMSVVVNQGKPWSLDGRALLQRIVEKLYGNYGIRLQVTFQNTFYLLNASGEEITVTDETCYAVSEALSIHQKFINAFSDNLIAQDIAVKNVCAGLGPGQLSFATGHRDPLTAADQQIMFRETARTIARQDGHIASFLPKIFADEAGRWVQIILLN